MDIDKMNKRKHYALVIIGISLVFGILSLAVPENVEPDTLDSNIIFCYDVEGNKLKTSEVWVPYDPNSDFIYLTEPWTCDSIMISLGNGSIEYFINNDGALDVKYEGDVTELAKKFFSFYFIRYMKENCN